MENWDLIPSRASWKRLSNTLQRGDSSPTPPPHRHPEEVKQGIGCFYFKSNQGGWQLQNEKEGRAEVV